jgi:hypothetical protein
MKPLSLDFAAGRTLRSFDDSFAAMILRFWRRILAAGGVESDFEKPLYLRIAVFAELS